MARPRISPEAHSVHVFQGDDGLYRFYLRSASGRRIRDSESEDAWPSRNAVKRFAHNAYPDLRIVSEFS